MVSSCVKNDLKYTRDIIDTCRLCLVQNSTYSNILVNNDGEGIVYILKNLGISISPEDNWPKTLCSGCLRKIQIFQKLINDAKENETRLIDIFGRYQVQDSLAPPKDMHKDSADPTEENLLKTEDSNSNDVGNETFNLVEAEESAEEPQRRVTRGSYRKIQNAKEKSTKIFKNPQRKQQLKQREKSPENEKELLVDHEEQPIEEPGNIMKNKQGHDAKVDTAIHSFFKMECILCNIQFPRFTDVQTHFRKEHKCRGYVVCCKKKLNRPMKLYEHMNVHINPTKHQCPVCQKYYKTQDSMLMHKKLQHTPVEERKYFCEKCPKRFALAHALTAHMITHMAPEEKKHICETCGQAFALATILVQHIKRVHENAHVRVCEICAKVFRCKNIFEKHVLEHKNQLKPTIPCTVCGKMFSYLVAMQRHRRRHNTSGSLECPICQRVAANQQALQEHIKHNHRDRKNFGCDLCERVFRSRISLKEHVASSHTGQILYECRYCSKKFNSNANYFNHKKNAHPSEHKAEREKRLGQQIYLKPEIKKN